VFSHEEGGPGECMYIIRELKVLSGCQKTGFERARSHAELLAELLR